MTALSTVYSPLTTQQLKVPVQKALTKFWTEAIKSRKLAFQVDAEGKHSSVDTLGIDFIKETFIWEGGINEETMEVSLGELSDSREQEQDLVQFEVNPANVEKLLTGTEQGLLKGHKLMKLIEIVYLPNSDQWIVGGGRHRLVTLLTIMKQTYGAERMLVPVSVYRARTTQEVVEYIKASNTSRTMTQTEKTQLKLAAQGSKLQVFSSADEIFEQARGAKTLTALKDLCRMAFASILGESAVGNETTINAMGDIGASFFTKLTSGLNAHAKKTAEALLVILPNGQVFELVVKQATEHLIKDWASFKSMITVDTGKKNADGAPIIECNISRSGPKVFGKELADFILADVGAKLAEISQQQQAAVEGAKKAKAAESEQEKLRKQIAALDNSLATFKSIGAPVPTEMVASVEESKARLQAQIDALDAQASKAAPAPEAVPAMQQPAQDPAFADAVSSLLS